MSTGKYGSLVPMSESGIRVGEGCTLDAQSTSLASASTKIHLAILGVAMVDALGGPAEFHGRFSFPLVVSMIPNENFSLPAGVWTDDTSMTLCLARSIATFGGFDERHQLEAYSSWYRKGVLSAIDRCFDIGGSTQRALAIYAASRGRNIDTTLRYIDAELRGESCSGNGSLMRVLPIGLVYWRDEALAREYARRSSRTTHPNEVCQEACEVWTVVIVRIMEASAGGRALTKLDLVRIISDFSYTTTVLREALALPSGLEPPSSAATKDLESFYWAHHPILRLVAKTQANLPRKERSFRKTIPTVADLPSTGYILHTLVAALYCFLATENFEDGAILAVNLGSDADTVGAIYAGLAGVWYAEEMGHETDKYWTRRVREWRSMLFRGELVEEVAGELAGFSGTLDL